MSEQKPPSAKARLLIECEPHGHITGEDEATFGVGDVIYLTGLKPDGSIFGYYYVMSIRAMAEPAAPPAVDDNYVAYLRYGRRNDNPDLVFIEVCDSDAEGAFRVYSSPLTDAEVDAWLASDTGECSQESIDRIKARFAEKLVQLEDAAPPQGEWLGRCRNILSCGSEPHSKMDWCKNWTPLPPAPQEIGK